MISGLLITESQEDCGKSISDSVSNLAVGGERMTDHLIRVTGSMLVRKLVLLLLLHCESVPLQELSTRNRNLQRNLQYLLQFLLVCSCRKKN